MNKKLSLLIVAACISACSSNKKLDYVITETSTDKKPVWIDNISKYEKNKDNESDKYKYFRSEAESINRATCEQAAIANRNKAIAAEISSEIDNLYSGLTEVQSEELVTSDSKKEETRNLVKGKLSGVELKDSYWEKRKYSTELGADKDKVSYRCYQLARVKRKVHDKIVNEMINKQLKDIKSEETKDAVKKVVEKNADKADIDVELK